MRGARKASQAKSPVARAAVCPCNSATHFSVAVELALIAVQETRGARWCEADATMHLALHYLHRCVR